MNNEAATPEPKQRRQGNQSPANRSKAQSNRRSAHRARSDNPKPEWDENSAESGDGAGDFDENGQFIMNGVPRTAPKSTKKAKGSKQKPQNPNHANPSWDAVPSGEGEGTFDADGNFILPGHSSADQSAPKSVKRNKKSKQNPQPVASAPALPHGVTPLSASPARPVGFGTTPMKAYAGPTFHASPAASELPIPKFFSRSAPKAVHPAGLSNRLAYEDIVASQTGEQSNDLSSDNASPPRAVPTASVPEPAGVAAPPREESPLDLFFNADRKERAEKAKRLSSGPAAMESGYSKPQSSNMPGAQTVPQHWASIYGARPKHNRNHSTGSSKDIFSLEMDNDASSVTANFDPNSPSRRQFNTPDSTPGRNHQYGHGSNSPNSPSHRPVSVPAQSNALFPFTPRSAGTTPPPNLHTPPNTGIYNGDSESSLNHYGNRNLSPLFNAMKADINTRRQSGLRQEVLRSPQVSQGEFSSAQALPEMPKTTALDFLNAQIAKSHGHPPSNSVPGIMPMGLGAPAQADLSPTYARGHGDYQKPNQQQKPAGDLRSMEDDLKRMLNLNSGSMGGMNGSYGGFQQ